MWITEFFNHDFFIIVGGLTTVAAILNMFYIIYLIIKGILPVWLRLGMGLSKRKIAVFAKDEFYDLKSLLVDSGLFKEKNIVKIEENCIKKAQNINLLLVHWKYAGSKIDEILNIKDDLDALIIYAPHDEGRLEQDILKKINLHRNSLVVNFRGRLLNDILTSIITTSYEKK